MSETSEQNPTNGEQKAGGTLDLKNVSIKTLKDDLAGESGGEAKEDKSGWFSFLAKHKGEDQPPAATGEAPRGNQASSPSEPSPGVEAPLASPEPSGGSLDQALDQFKSETEAPANLPISDEEIKPNIESPAAEKLEKLEEPEKPKESEEVEEAPALGSFFPPKKESAEPAEEEESPVLTHLAPPIKGTEETTGIKPVGTIGPMSGEGITGDQGGKPIPEEKNDNPFSSHIQAAEKEKKSLLQSVESALNYSAPPEFSETRENQANPPQEEGGVVNLRDKAPTGAGGILKNKKLLIILGGAGGLVVIVIIILAMSLGGGSKKPAATANLNVNQANKNQNANPVPQLNTNAAAQPKPPVLEAQKILPTTLEKSVNSVNAISQEIENLKAGQPVSKQTQLIFTRPDGSVASFQDLATATGINIPQKVLAQPGAAPALIFADFFRGQTILGLVIPTTDTPDIAFSKMKSWESTMVIDLDYLWEGIDIDNKGAYFADSQLFQDARFALIDKRDKLSLDYAVDNGYILITCGRDSMTILKNNFITPPASSIKFESESTTTTSGVDTANSNANSGASATTSGQ